MLEICLSIADGKPSRSVPIRLASWQGRPRASGFNTPPGSAINVALMDLGNRFRLLLNEVDVVAPPPHGMPRLPVARAVWRCRPNFEDACACWIYAGGAITPVQPGRHNEMIEDFAAIAGLELAIIDGRPTSAISNKPCAPMRFINSLSH